MIRSCYTIYVVQNNINKKLYIGQTSTKLNLRWNHHKSKGRSYEKGKSFSRLHAAIKKYGEENFTIRGLKEVSTLKQANRFETLLISVYDTINKGYNISPGGSSMSEETRAKISKAHQGKILSLEHRKKITASLMGNTNTKGMTFPEAVKLRYQIMIDKTPPLETLKKIRETHIEKELESDRKICNSQYKGVSGPAGAYQARKMYGGVRYYFGTYKTKDEAQEALIKGLQELKSRHY